MGRARSRAEQLRLVRAWRRSELTAQQFAATAGVSVASLHRWSSAHGRSGGSAREPALIEAVPLNEAVVERGGWDWEVELGGCAVRGHGSIDGDIVKAIASALSRGRRR